MIALSSGEHELENSQNSNLVENSRGNCTPVGRRKSSPNHPNFPHLSELDAMGDDILHSYASQFITKADKEKGVGRRAGDG